MAKAIPGEVMTLVFGTRTFTFFFSGSGRFISRSFHLFLVGCRSLASVLALATDGDGDDDDDGSGVGIVLMRIAFAFDHL